MFYYFLLLLLILSLSLSLSLFLLISFRISKILFRDLSFHLSSSDIYILIFDYFAHIA